MQPVLCKLKQLVKSPCARTLLNAFPQHTEKALSVACGMTGAMQHPLVCGAMCSGRTKPCSCRVSYPGCTEPEHTAFSVRD